MIVFKTWIKYLTLFEMTICTILAFRYDLEFARHWLLIILA